MSGVAEVHVFPLGDGSWAVSVGGDERRFGAREEAMSVARELARSHAPSRLVHGTPASTVRHSDDIPSAATPANSEQTAGPPAPAGSSWARLAGPSELGRSVVVALGADVPDPWRAAERRAIRTSQLGDPHLLEAVRLAYVTRTPVVYEIERRFEGDGADADAQPAADVWRLPVDFEPAAAATAELVAANSVDAFEPARPRWPLVERAVAAGASAGGRHDVVLPDGREAICDGGPLELWPAASFGGAPVVPRVALEMGSLSPLTDAPAASGLAPDQLAAVLARRARARVIAPAGSGKTRVLTERARHLVHSGLPPASLCLVAYNRRAQGEMRNRTRDLEGIEVETLNALGLSIVTSEAARSGSRPPRTIDEIAVRELLRGLVKFPRRRGTDPASAWIDALSAVRLGLRDPREVERSFGGDVDGLVEIFPRYRSLLAGAGVVDFDEQIYRAIEVLVAGADGGRRGRTTRGGRRLLLVDEFQDLTPAHLLLIRLLAGPELSVFGVGDDDQTIYGYAGASPAWLIDFDRYFAGAVHHDLEVNYRCPPEVVEGAVALLSRNSRRVAKSIRAAAAGADGALRVITSDDPTEATLARVCELVESGTPPADVAVLTRVNALLPPVQAGLHLAGIPSFNRDGARLLERQGVAAALAWLRMALDPAHLQSRDVAVAARRPGRGVSPRVAEWMAEQRDVRSLRRLASRLSKDGAKVEEFADDIEAVARVARGGDTVAVVGFVCSDIGLDDSLRPLDEVHLDRNASGHADDLRALRALARMHREAATFGSWLADALRGHEDPNGVQLSTVHRVKGLEWPHVIVHDASAGCFPHRLSTDVEEERRIFHVALTRCRTSLTLVADAAEPSPFLGELHPATTPPAAAQWPAAGEGGGEASPSRWAPSRAGRARTPGGAGAAARAGAGTLPGRSAAATDPALLAALRGWRSARAKSEGVPAYVIATDKTLEEIASRRPSSLRALGSVRGIGAVRLQRFGEEILAVLGEHSASSPASAPIS